MCAPKSLGLLPSATAPLCYLWRPFRLAAVRFVRLRFASGAFAAVRLAVVRVALYVSLRYALPLCPSLLTGSIDCSRLTPYVFRSASLFRPSRFIVSGSLFLVRCSWSVVPRSLFLVRCSWSVVRWSFVVFRVSCFVFRLSSLSLPV